MKKKFTNYTRLSTIQNSDIIFVMDKGRVVAQGTHDELKENSPEYQRLACPIVADIRGSIFAGMPFFLCSAKNMVLRDIVLQYL
jgi:hypothetical protein